MKLLSNRRLVLVNTLLVLTFASTGRDTTEQKDDCQSLVWTYESAPVDSQYGQPGQRNSYLRQLYVQPGMVPAAHSSSIRTLQIPLTMENVLGLALIGTLALIGIAYVWVLYKRKRCACRLCRGDLILGDCIGSGGFGSVYLVTEAVKSNWEQVISDQLVAAFGSEDPFSEQDPNLSKTIQTPQKVQPKKSKRKQKKRHLKQTHSTSSESVEQTEEMPDIKEEESKTLILKKLEMEDLNELEQVQHEAKQLRLLNHRCIVAYQDEFLHEDSRALSQNKYKYLLVMQYCPLGDLTTKIERTAQEKRRMPEADVMSVFLDVLEAMKYIHSRDIIHRDIKSANVFIAADNSAKLGDFGLCIHGKSIRTRQSGRYSTAVGTEHYLAPELHKGSLFKKGKASDVWALGCVLLEMMLVQPLWEIDFGGGTLGIKCIEEPNFAQDFVQRKLHDDFYDSALKSILKKMLATDPRNRPNVEDILRKKHIKQWQKKSAFQRHRENRKAISKLASAELSE